MDNKVLKLVTCAGAAAAAGSALVAYELWRRLRVRLPLPAVLNARWARSPRPRRTFNRTPRDPVLSRWPSPSPYVCSSASTQHLHGPLVGMILAHQVYRRNAREAGAKAVPFTTSLKIGIACAQRTTGSLSPTLDTHSWPARCRRHTEYPRGLCSRRGNAARLRRCLCVPISGGQALYHRWQRGGSQGRPYSPCIPLRQAACQWHPGNLSQNHAPYQVHPTRTIAPPLSLA